MTYFDEASGRMFESYEDYQRERIDYYVWTRYERAQMALLMIENNEHGESWSAGVAMSARCAIEEIGYPKPHPLPDLFGPYTMGAKLCDADGIVRSGRFFEGTEYPCTGHAHFAGEHVECTSSAHADDQPARTAHATHRHTTPENARALLAAVDEGTKAGKTHSSVQPAEREHVLTADCWCNPVVDKVEPEA